MSNYKIVFDLYILKVTSFCITNAYHQNQNLSMSQVLFASKLNMFRYFINILYIIILSSNLLRVPVLVIDFSSNLLHISW